MCDLIPISIFINHSLYVNYSSLPIWDQSTVSRSLSDVEPKVNIKCYMYFHLLFHVLMIFTITSRSEHFEGNTRTLLFIEYIPPDEEFTFVYILLE